MLRKRLLGKKGQWLTQSDLSELLELSIQEVGRIERGQRRPSFEGLFLLAAALYQPPHMLFPELWQRARDFIAQRREQLGIGNDELRSI